MLERRQERNVNVKISKKSKRLRNVNVKSQSMLNQRKAEHLVEKFERLGCDDASGCLFFFVKCFSRLSEDAIWSIYEKATTDKTIRFPIKYFIGACRNQMNS